ncbi:MAG: ABC transporter ATP-binding protein, partial [Lachnospiraceae bacterium]|nr:ABC transporter ATP-binding protein [Lachnospiraceae bacterium]
GIILTVSHDRYFLDRVVTRIFSFEKDGSLMQSEGGYSDYVLRKKAMEDADKGLQDKGYKSRNRQSDLDNDASDKASKTKNRTVREKTKLSYAEQKEYDNIESEIEELELRCNELEKEIALSSTDYTRLMQLQSEKEELETTIEKKMERYIELQEMVDSFAKK